MTDQVLTDDEKDALLDGVESGEVEVQSIGGPKYAAVMPFEIKPRDRIVTNSFPRLQNINRKFAASISNTASQFLNDKVEVTVGELTYGTWGDFAEQSTEAAAIFEFSPKPLEGTAVVHIQATVVNLIVEKFYGGSNEHEPRDQSEGFTRGEMNVVTLFCEDMLASLNDAWQALIGLAPEKVDIHQSTDMVEIVDNGANVIATEFQFCIGEDQQLLHIVWPTATITPLMPIFEGHKADRDAVEDDRWEQVIRSRVPEANIEINSCVGNSQLSLRSIAKLEPGDIIDIENPRKGVVFADDVPVLEGRFGVHDGCYAIEATRWLSSDQATDAAPP